MIANTHSTKTTRPYPSLPWVLPSCHTVVDVYGIAGANLASLGDQPRV